MADVATVTPITKIKARDRSRGVPLEPPHRYPRPRSHQTRPFPGSLLLVIETRLLGN